MHAGACGGPGGVAGEQRSGALVLAVPRGAVQGQRDDEGQRHCCRSQTRHSGPTGGRRPLRDCGTRLHPPRRAAGAPASHLALLMLNCILCEAAACACTVRASVCM